MPKPQNIVTLNLSIDQIHETVLHFGMHSGMTTKRSMAIFGNAQPQMGHRQYPLLDPDRYGDVWYHQRLEIRITGFDQL